MGLCAAVTANLAAKRGKRSRVEDPVSYALGAAVRNSVNSYRAKGGPDRKARDAEATVKRRAAERAGVTSPAP